MASSRCPSTLDAVGSLATGPIVVSSSNGMPSRTSATRANRPAISSSWTPAATRIRSVESQIWPALAKQPKAVRATALSISASSKMIVGPLPPSSSSIGLPAAALGDDAAGPAGAGEADGDDAGVAGHLVAHLRWVAQDEIEGTVRDPGVEEAAHQVRRRDRCPFGRLPHHRVARGQAGRQVFAGNRHWEVPRSQDPVHPPWLADREHSLRRVRRGDDSGLQALDRLRRIAEHLRRHLDLGQRLGDVRLALLKRDVAGDLLLPLLEQLRHPVAEPGPLEHGHHSQAVLSRLGGHDRLADMFAGALGKPADQLAGCGGAQLDRIQLAFGPVATDAERNICQLVHVSEPRPQEAVCRQSGERTRAPADRPSRRPLLRSRPTPASGRQGLRHRSSPPSGSPGRPAGGAGR